MKKLILILAFVGSYLMPSAQTLKPYPVPLVGANVKMPCAPGKVEIDKYEKEDGDSVLSRISSKCNSSGLTYGYIYLIKSAVEYGADYTTTDELKGTLASHRDLLNCKPTMIGMMTPETSADGKTISLKDKWESYEGGFYLVRGILKGDGMVILYIKSKAKITETPAIKSFLNGFEFGL